MQIRGRCVIHGLEMLFNPGIQRSGSTFIVVLVAKRESSTDHQLLTAGAGYLHESQQLFRRIRYVHVHLPAIGIALTVRNVSKLQANKALRLQQMEADYSLADVQPATAAVCDHSLALTCGGESSLRKGRAAYEWTVLVQQVKAGAHVNQKTGNALAAADQRFHQQRGEGGQRLAEE